MTKNESEAQKHKDNEREAREHPGMKHKVAFFLVVQLLFSFSVKPPTLGISFSAGQRVTCECNRRCASLSLRHASTSSDIVGGLR